MVLFSEIFLPLDVYKRQIQEVLMIIELDMSSSTPIYVQLRNPIVKGIGKGELKTCLLYTSRCV